MNAELRCRICELGGGNGKDVSDAKYGKNAKEIRL